jgi:hypothetical protein
MEKKQLHEDSEFIVSDDKWLVYIMAFLFFGIFVYGFADATIKGFKNLSYLSYIFFLLLVPAFLFFRKGRANRIYIRINKSGIYQNEKLVTGWPGFLNAFVTQKEKVLSIQDNFILVVEYVQSDKQKGLRRKIPLTNTQNKSEEEVMKAIIYFRTVYKRSQL